MALLTRKSLLLIKSESPYGSDANPGGADALQVRSIDVTPLEADVVSRELIRPWLGNNDQLLANSRVLINFQVELTGSGTAATAPRFGALLKACGMAETTTGAAVTGTATAGAAGSITLGAGASAVDDAYIGMVISLSAGTGSGSSGIITDYVGSTKVATVQPTSTSFAPDATSGYSIAANVSYKPVSSSFGSVTIYYNNDGVLHKATGCRGTFSINAEVGAIPTIDFQFTGIYNAPTDTAAPTATFGAQADPLLFKPGNSSTFSFIGYSGCLQSLSLDIANDLVYRGLVGCSKEILITNRTPSGECRIEAVPLATKDYFAIANNGTTGAMTVLHGVTAGNRVSLVAPKVDITSPTYADQDGVQMLNLPFVAVPTAAGNDEVVLTFS